MSRYEMSKHDFAITLAALRALRHSLMQMHRMIAPGEAGELALYIQRTEGLIDRMDLAHTAYIELED